MACETPKEAWDKLKEEFQGTERTRQQQLLNLRRDFENLKMKEAETVKQYSDRIMAVVNSIRLLEEQFSEARIVEKVMSTLPESKEEPADKRSTRKGLFKPKKPRASKLTKAKSSRKTGLSLMLLGAVTNSADIVKELVIQKIDAGLDQMQYANTARKKGHVEKVCKNRSKPRQNQFQQQKVEARVTEESSDKEEHVFAVSCAANQKKGSKGWLLDSGCTNHMSPDATIFKTLDRTCKTKVKIGNGQLINAEGRGDVLIHTSTGGKIISNVLLVPEIDRNLLSITQLLEKGYSVVFKEKECQIFYPSGSNLITVTMTDKCFEVDWPNDLHSACIASTDDSRLWH
ncbi:uncharacterized protein [Gossypium hirsutum]|uniref:Retrovirus-related Pol polyprotein from transposon TNT 1-94-like beta-barrel domain-containing protein n=1 Tax=Gossypium hirsutum TaxID=3635 RepID=A0ABM3BF88_GOSHI|nr:uncharacterized protein LOC121225471 [Gossypium hirsutum]